MTRQQHRILVVDDLPDWRATLSGLLVDAGYYTEVTDSLPGALQLLENNRFDLAVVDMRLDETDEANTEGLNLAATIKERWPSVKVVLITGYETPEKLQEALEPKAQGSKLVAEFIPKTQSDELVQRVRKALAD